MKLKIAIAGVGSVARNNYIPFLAAQPEVELGYYNRDQSKAEAAAAKFGGTVFGSLETLLVWQPDVAFVLTSETVHHEIGERLIRGGVKRVLFEKPLVALRGQAHVSEADFQRGKDLLALAGEHGCEAAMMFNYRFFEQTLAAKRVIAERRFGKLITVSGQIHYACWSHCIDLVHHFGGAAQTIVALAGSVSREGQGIVAPDLTIAFRLEQGGTGTLLGTAGMKWQHPLFELLLTFENGRIHLRDIDGDMEVLDGTSRITERYSAVRDASRWDHYKTSFAKALRAYLDAISEGKPVPVSGLDGLRELQFEVAVRRSVDERRPVVVQTEFPL